MNLSELKDLLQQGQPLFWRKLASATEQACGFDELMVLSALRKKALARGLPRTAVPPSPLRFAILGGCNLYPLHELLAHLLDTIGVGCEMFLGEYDNYVAEMTEPNGALYQFRPEVVLLLPNAQRCKHSIALSDPIETVRATAEQTVVELLNLARGVHERTAAEVLLVNFALPARHDPGSFRTRTLASDWSFRKWVNMELGLRAPPFLEICDLEFLVHRHGALAGEDARGWFESKQPCSPALLVELCREAAQLICRLRHAPKKVLALDLDNTLWGGEIAEAGIEGIELGDTSPRGEAFKAFQKYVASLKDRGVLLAVCSKNDLAVALEPFAKHPEMVLRREDFASFISNWEPKSDNLQRMAAELGLGLDSFVFVDDSPAEVALVRQFAPEVTTILLAPDPADFVGQLKDCRLFEPRQLTREDAQRAGQYQAERGRKTLLATVADMDAYLESLAMEAVLREFTPVDVPRLAQLINKSNQFNLTTRRRTDAEVRTLLEKSDHVCFSVRPRDRFGDHGLVAIVIGCVRGEALEIDTWLMSCRVLKRQVEDVTLNEFVRLAMAKGCTRLDGVYVATPKNAMVRGFYSRMGFEARSATPQRAEFFLELKTFRPHPTKITIRSCAYDEPN